MNSHSYTALINSTDRSSLIDPEKSERPRITHALEYTKPFRVFLLLQALCKANIAISAKMYKGDSFFQGVGCKHRQSSETARLET